MYRSQDIGSRSELICTCVAVLQRGRVDELFQILPHIAITRDPRYCPLLIDLLEGDNRDLQIFAAIALGSLACDRSVAPLSEALRRPDTYRGADTQSLQQALIYALGESGQATAVEPLWETYWDRGTGRFAGRRRELIMTALGTLAQQQVEAAAALLGGLLASPKAHLRARAVTELGVAAWGRPSIAAEWEDSIRACLLDPDEGVQFAAWAALENLAHLGSRNASWLLEQVLEAVPA